MCKSGFEMLIPDANVLSHLKLLCHFPGGCMTECPEGPLLMMLSPPHSKYWREGQAFPTCSGRKQTVLVTLLCPFSGQNVSWGTHVFVGFETPFLRGLWWKYHCNPINHFSEHTGEKNLCSVQLVHLCSGIVQNLVTPTNTSHFDFFSSSV